MKNNLRLLCGLIWIIFIHSADAVNLCLHLPDGMHVNNPAKCNLYFLCVSGQEILRTCPDGLYFDPILLFCDLKENIDCDDTTVCTGITSGLIVDHKDSCEGFFYCFNEIPYAAYCPPPLYFNPQSNRCDDMENVECDFHTETPTVAPPSPNILCNNIPDSTLIRNPDSCSSFYLCLDGVALLGECPESLLFNSKTRQCDHYDNVVCDEEMNEKAQCKGEPDMITINNPMGCADFFLCFNEFPIPLKCPSPLMYNSFDNVCDDSMIDRCHPICDGVAEQTFVTNPYDCRGWYICMSGEPYASGICPNDFYFNVVKQRCDHPDNVVCETIETTTAETTTLVDEEPTITTEEEPITTTFTPPDDNGVPKQLPSLFLFLLITINFLIL